MRVPGYFAGQFIGGVRALSFSIRGRMQYAPTLPVDCMGSFCQLPDLDAPSDVPGKGTNAGVGFGCRVRFWDCGGGGGDVTGPFLGLRRGRRGRDGSVFWTAEGWGLPIRQVF